MTEQEAKARRKGNALLRALIYCVNGGCLCCRTRGDLADHDLLGGAAPQRHARHVQHLLRRHQHVLVGQVLRKAQRRGAARHDGHLQSPSGCVILEVQIQCWSDTVTTWHIHLI